MDASVNIKKIFIVPIEPIDQRYTKQWYDFLPRWLEDNTEYLVETIDGISIPNKTTKGAFLDFGATNAYKASQIIKIAELFQAGEVKPGDNFIVTDAWNFAITSIRYMSELLDIPVKIHGIWHAGNYDPSDILGMKMSNDWAGNQERAWFLACDYNYFATTFHLNMFMRNLFGDLRGRYEDKIFRSGQPHGLIIDFMENLPKVKKENIIMWPHRYNDDKQPKIAEDLAKHFNVVITQKMNLGKKEYYEIMAKSKIIFSCALHENLGISVMEGTMAGCVPIVPNRCSYGEMYDLMFKYPSKWTESFELYLQYKDLILAKISTMMDEYNNREVQSTLLEQQKILKSEYLSATTMLLNLK